MLLPPGHITSHFLWCLVGFRIWIWNNGAQCYRLCTCSCSLWGFFLSWGLFPSSVLCWRYGGRDPLCCHAPLSPASDAFLECGQEMSGVTGSSSDSQFLVRKCHFWKVTWTGFLRSSHLVRILTQNIRIGMYFWSYHSLIVNWPKWSFCTCPLQRCCSSACSGSLWWERTYAALEATPLRSCAFGGCSLGPSTHLWGTTMTSPMLWDTDADTGYVYGLLIQMHVQTV